MHPQPAAVIYLTGGICPAPEKMALPTLWVLTQEGEKPVSWGVELRLDLQQHRTILAQLFQLNFSPISIVFNIN